MSRKEFRTLADPAEVSDTVASLSLAGGTEYVDLPEAHGRVLAEQITADIDVPGFDRASMDGYAVRARDTIDASEVNPAVLKLAGTVHAGEKPDLTVEPGTCIEISTGAVMPDGSDAVVVVERTEEIEADGELRIECRSTVTPSENVMLAGADIAAGMRALGPGTRLTPREIGLLSAVGCERVPVVEPPRVGIISTGEELVRPGEPLDSQRGEIYDVNSHTIAAGVEAAGGEPVVYPHAGDDFQEMERLLRQAADECDLVLSSGSTSASAVDVIYRVIEDRGELLVHGVAVKPGKPMLVGRLDRSDGGHSAYIGLPGYPVSALTIFRSFVAPAIRQAVGRPEPATASLTGRMATEARSEEGRLRLLSVGVFEDSEGRRLVYPVDKGSGATMTLAEADGVVRIDPNTDYLEAGEQVTVELFSPDVRPPELLGIGEDDPALSVLLDRVGSTHYLPMGSREGLRRLRNGLPDFAVVAGPGDRSDDAVSLGAWHREWGLIVPDGNPAGIETLADLIDSDLRFVNRETTSGLRTSLSNLLAEVAETRGVARHSLVDAIEGFESTVKAFESPARRVIEGRADVGLGLKTTADKHGLGFVSLGDQRVAVLINSARREKPAADRLEAEIGTLADHCTSLAGYRFAGE